MAAKSQSKKKARQPVSKRQQLLEQASALTARRWFRFTVIWGLSYAILLSFFFRTVLRDFAYIEIFPHELILPLLMHALTAFLITNVVFWPKQLATFAGKLAGALALSLLTTDYDANLQAASGPIRAFIPGFSPSDPLTLVSLVYLALLVAIAFIIGKLIERLLARTTLFKARDLELGMAVLAIYLLLAPGFTLVRILPSMIREADVQAPELTKKTASASPAADKPDIYYIVLDRYTNSDVLKKQFNYDNSPFTGFLKDNGFHVNDEAYGNYPYTTMSISSTMNAQYTKDLVAPFKNSDVQSRTLYHNLIWQSSVAKALKKDGYKYYAIGSWYGTTYRAPLADIDFRWEHQLTIFGVKKRLRGIEANEFSQSPYYRFGQISGLKWWPFKIEDKNNVDDVREQLNLLDNLSAQKPGGRFIFAHILVPHDPFVFNGDGSLSANPDTNSVGKPIKDKYVGQVQFINDQMKELVSNIQEKSGDKAVIIFNADEGAYPQIMSDTFKVPTTGANVLEDGIVKNEDMRGWTDDWLKMKFGVLQAVHIPKATSDDLAHLSSVNLFRIVLNRYAGYDLDYLPECHFGITNGTQDEYNYADITKRFVSSPDKSCQKLQNLPDK